jgi:hypothetical protein
MSGLWVLAGSVGAAAVPSRDVGGLWQGWVPFLDPMNIHAAWWYTALPLALFVSMAYKAVKHGNMRTYWRGVSVMTASILVGMVGFAFGLHALVEWIIPALRG